MVRLAPLTGGLALAGLCLVPGPLAAREAGALAGAWDLTLESSHRKCKITLDGEAAAVGRGARFPAGCRRALPILKNVEGWDTAERGALRLIDREGRPALAFEASAEPETYLAKTESGEVYRLGRREASLQVARAPPPAPIGVPQRAWIDPATAPKPDTLPGTYWVDRYTEREVCRIALGRALVDGAGRAEARILDGCRDTGLSTFDPVAWRYEAGRLTLTARRGHEVTLISEREGQWRRDPEVGATLVLRKGPDQ